MNLPNISNKISKNIFESYSGVLNIAPIKISGQYKIIVDTKFNLWFDDYTDRRVLIDKDSEFLPQLANFLKVKTKLISNECLHYGAFQRGTKKYYHAPLYISNDKTFPKYFTVSRVINEQLPADQLDLLYMYGDIKLVVNLEKIGLTKIFNQINEIKNFNFPLNLNIDDFKIDLFGYSYNTLSPAVCSINILNNMANQPYIDVFDNNILNEFSKNNLIFPRFINIEFEFDYQDSKTFFNNFFGFYSNNNIIPIEEHSDDKYDIILKEYESTIEWKQCLRGKQVILNEYLDLIGTCSIQEVNQQPPIIRLRCNQVNIDDSIKIYHPDGFIFFEYLITKKDIIQTSLYQSLIKICTQATKASGRSFIFDVKQDSNIITIQANINDELIEDFYIEIPKWFDILDRYEGTSSYNKFRQIISNDVWLRTITKLMDNINHITIDKTQYEIIDKFMYNDVNIIRLDIPSRIDGLTYIEIYETKKEKLINLSPITWLSPNSDLKVLEHYNQKNYCTELHTIFDNQETGHEDQDRHRIGAKKAIDDFLSSSFNEAILPYVDDDIINKELVPSDIVRKDDGNTDSILDLMFCNGSNSFIAPNILNIEKQFYANNLSTNYNEFDNDKYAFNWFLINGVCPEYLKNDIRSLRYFDKLNNETPKITSKFVKTGYDTCETIFLGIKYQLPARFENYLFATYINFNDELYIETKYLFEIDDEKKTIYLSINRYLDFIDLLRGCNIKNTPIIDLSFFYNVRKSYNEFSEFLYGFKSGSILFCDNKKPVLFDTKEVNDWKYESDGKWYICLKSSDEFGSMNFKDLFPESGKADFYVYSTIMYNGIEYTYISVTYTLVGIKQVGTNFIWCEDLLVKFWDTKNIFINKYGIQTGDGKFDEEIMMVKKSNIIAYRDEIDDVDFPFGDYVQISTLLKNNGLTEKLRLTLPNKQLSFKEIYFELTKSLRYTNNGEEIHTKSYFVFPEFKETERIQKSKLWDTFECNSFDESTYDSTITLFQRNQLWKVIQDLMTIDIKFKFLTERQIRLLINEFLCVKLKEYCELYQISDSKNDYAKLTIIPMTQNVVVWKILENKAYQDKTNNINRYNGPYFPYLNCINDEFNFQLPKFKKENSLMSLYDKNFGGSNINATGLWQEVFGNIVSTLFCNNNPIVLTINYVPEFDYRKLLIETIKIDDCVINDDNKDYILKFDKNTNRYIIEKFVDYLLGNQYSFYELKNEVGERLGYNVDSKNPYLIKLFKLSMYQTNFKKLILTFNRK